MLARLASKSLNVSARSRLSTDVFSTESKTADYDITPNIPEAEESIKREEDFRLYVERMRNVGRFSKAASARKFNKKLPTFCDTEALYLKKQNYFRKVYSQFGKNCGIEAGVAWPTKQELLTRINDEGKYDLSLKEKIEALVNRKQDEIERIVKL